jgi:hypothetical protein
MTSQRKKYVMSWSRSSWVLNRLWTGPHSRTRDSRYMLTLSRIFGGQLAGLSFRSSLQNYIGRARAGLHSE